MGRGPNLTQRNGAAPGPGFSAADILPEMFGVPPELIASEDAPETLGRFIAGQHLHNVLGDPANGVAEMVPLALSVNRTQYLPFYNPLTVATNGVAAAQSLSGRILEAQIPTGRLSSGEPIAMNGISVVAESYAPTYLALEASSKEAATNGRFFGADDLLNDDKSPYAYGIFSLKPDAKNPINSEETGDWLLSDIITSLDPHPYGAVLASKNFKTTTGDQVKPAATEIFFSTSVEKTVGRLIKDMGSDFFYGLMEGVTIFLQQGHEGLRRSKLSQRAKGAVLSYIEGATDPMLMRVPVRGYYLDQACQVAQHKLTGRGGNGKQEGLAALNSIRKRIVEEVAEGYAWMLFRHDMEGRGQNYPDPTRLIMRGVDAMDIEYVLKMAGTDWCKRKFGTEILAQEAERYKSHRQNNVGLYAQPIGKAALFSAEAPGFPFQQVHEAIAIRRIMALVNKNKIGPYATEITHSIYAARRHGLLLPGVVGMYRINHPSMEKPHTMLVVDLRETISKVGVPLIKRALEGKPVGTSSERPLLSDLLGAPDTWGAIVTLDEAERPRASAVGKIGLKEGLQIIRAKNRGAVRTTQGSVVYERNLDGGRRSMIRRGGGQTVLQVANPIKDNEVLVAGFGIDEKGAVHVSGPTTGSVGDKVTLMRQTRKPLSFKD